MAGLPSWAGHPPMRTDRTVKHRVCTIEETSNGYVIRLYETEDRSMLSGDAEWFIERTLVSVEKRIESYFLLAQSTE